MKSSERAESTTDFEHDYGEWVDVSFLHVKRTETVIGSCDSQHLGRLPQLIYMVEIKNKQLTECSFLLITDSFYVKVHYKETTNTPD